MELMTPRLNQQSLIQMAIRHKTSITASGNKSALLSLFTNYLHQSIEELSFRQYSPEELNEVEKDLEVLEAALIHLWISVPYNKALVLPKNLDADQINRIQSMAKVATPFKRHLRLAYYSAA